MAIIKFGGGVAGISGKIGGTVFGRNKAGAYARNWAKPVNPVTPSQSTVRAIFGNQSAAWGALTSSERDQWNGAAASIERINRFGETYTPSGRQYFLEIANSLSQVGLANISSPPTGGSVPPNAPSDAILTATAAAGVLTVLSIAFTSYTGNESLIVEAAPPGPDTKTNVNTQYRQIEVIPSPATTPANILASYIALFGNSAQTGDVIRIRLTAIDDGTGLRSPQFLTQDTV